MAARARGARPCAHTNYTFCYENYNYIITHIHVQLYSCTRATGTPRREPAPRGPAAAAGSRVQLAPARARGGSAVTQVLEASAMAVAEWDEEMVREDIKNALPRSGYDDGSIAPVLIRLAWHSCGTYNRKTKTGGSSNCSRGGATMRFGAEKSDPENAGLDIAMSFLEPIKEKHPSITYADLWILAGCVAVEATGGPHIPFTRGRPDATDDSNLPVGDAPKWQNPNGSRLPAADLGPSRNPPPGCPMHVKEKPTIEGMAGVFRRMGVSDRELVALICVGHVYGRCHTERSGYAGPWVEEMLLFSNEYAADMLEDEWIEITHDSQNCPDEEVRPAPGKRQWVSLGPGDDGSDNEGSGSDEGPPKQMMLITDMALLWNPAWRKWLEYYADDNKGEDRLAADFAIAFQRLTELGFLPSADEQAHFPDDPEAPVDDESSALEDSTSGGPAPLPASRWGTSWGTCSRVRLGLEELDMLRCVQFDAFLDSFWWLRSLFVCMLWCSPTSLWQFMANL